VGSGSSISVWNDPWLPTTRPRPANKNNHNHYPDLTVDSLIDPTTRNWNLQALRDLVDPQDVKLIESIPLSRIQMVDRAGWHFTNNGRYTVKSGYQVERVYPDRERSPIPGRWCFTDGSWKENDNFSGQEGWIIKQAECTQSFQNISSFVASPLMAEGLAMRDAIRKCKELGIRRFRCESDSTQLIK
ncbi:unnamed protein product, partial [Brassica rapa subsp. trilocularis]